MISFLFLNSLLPRLWTSRHAVLPPSLSHILLLLFCCVSCTRGVWLNVATALEKCSKMCPVVEHGVAFLTKCHCRHTIPRYWAVIIDHLYDMQQHTHTRRIHSQFVNVWVGSSTSVMCIFLCVFKSCKRKCWNFCDWCSNYLRLGRSTEYIE